MTNQDDGSPDVMTNLARDDLGHPITEGDLIEAVKRRRKVAHDDGGRT